MHDRLSEEAATDTPVGQEPHNSCGSTGQQINSGLDAGHQLIGPQPVANAAQTPLLQLTVAPVDPVLRNAVMLFFSQGVSYITFQLILAQSGPQGASPPIQLIFAQRIPQGGPIPTVQMVITQLVAQGFLNQLLTGEGVVQPTVGVSEPYTAATPVNQQAEPHRIDMPHRLPPMLEGGVSEPIISPPIPRPISVSPVVESISTPSVAQTALHQQHIQSLRSLIGMTANPDAGLETTFAVFIGLIALLTTAAAIFSIPPPNTPEPSNPKAISLLNETIASTSSKPINGGKFWGSLFLFVSNMLLFSSIILGALAAIWAYICRKSLNVGKVLPGALALFFIQFLAAIFKFAPGTFSFKWIHFFRHERHFRV